MNNRQAVAVGKADSPFARTVWPERDKDMAGSAVLIDVDTKLVFILAGVAGIAGRDCGQCHFNKFNHVC